MKDCPVPTQLQPWLIDLLRDPVSGDRLSESEGELCTAAGVSYPVSGGVPRFVAQDGYVSNFSLEWTRHAKTQLDTATTHESEDTFRAKTGFAPEDLKKKTVLDAGCGMGRFADVAERWGARVVGVDLSFSVDAARRNLRGRENVAILQANLYDLPFAPESFDYVYSIGVLPFTPDPAKAFAAIARLVKPGGSLAVWVYERNPLFRISDGYRRVTTKMPQPTLYNLCRVAGPLYYVHKLPLVGRVSRVALPISMHPKWKWRVLDTFDWYSPVYQWKHTYPEVARWFEQAGYDNLKLLDPPLSIRGRRRP